MTLSLRAQETGMRLPASAGRMCPFDYRYDPEVFRRAPDLEAQILYVAGGLYGNLAALDAIERLAKTEKTPVTIVFNGDFHWFDAEPDWFSEIERRVGAYHAIRGNVETEIARDGDIGAGCGCAYPETVDDDVVQRSNEILLDLRKAAQIPSARTRLGRLPMHAIARVGALRVGIVHGDAASLAGWHFAQDALDSPANWPWLADVRRAAPIDVFASTHTCLAALRDFALPHGRLIVINNGASGMSNFAGSPSGLLTRIATRPSPHRPLYGLVRDGVHVDAIGIGYDTEAFLRRFLARWPEGSSAHASYYRRIVAGPDHSIARAEPRSYAAALAATA
jgi:hypothetical protein